MHPVSHITRRSSIFRWAAYNGYISAAFAQSGTVLAFPRGMPVRTFVDRKGATWRVWATRPSRAAVLSSEFAEGWLTFESEAGGVRRLAPVPDGWLDVSDDRLYLMCRAAEPMPRHTPILPGELLPPTSDPSAGQPEAP